MDKPQNVISKIVEHSQYLTQRDNVNTLSEKRDKEPSNQCMVASFGEWALQFGFFANLEKWQKQFNSKTVEEIIYTIVVTHVNELNKKNPKNPTSRFHSEHFIFMFNQILFEFGWKLQSEKATIEKIKSVIDTGQSVVVGTNISSFLPGASGHIQNCIGYYTNNDGNLLGFIFNDPYGDCETGYKIHNGENRYYSLDTVKKLLSPCGLYDVRLMVYAVRTK